MLQKRIVGQGVQWFTIVSLLLNENLSLIKRTHASEWCDAEGFRSDCELTGGHETCLSFLVLYSITSVVLTILLALLCMIRIEQHRMR